MKRSICILLLAAALASAETPREPKPDALPAEPPPGTERTCYIGLATSSATPTLREELGLGRGTGVVVEMVEPGSPSEVAGLQTHDVIVRLNDQLVVNVPQLSVLVRLQKPGTPIVMHVLRHGQAMDFKVIPTQRDLPPLEDFRPNAGTMILPRPGVGRSCSIITHTDGDDVITLTTRDDDRHVTIKDLQGNLVYDGPLNTTEDQAKLPPALREKLDRILANSERIKELMPRPN